MMDELLPLIRRATWTVVGFGLFFHANAAEVPDIDSLGRPAQQALQSYFRTGDKASLQNALVSARNDLALKAQSEPARAAIATVLLRTPVNVQGLSSVIAGGDVIEVVSRTPVGKRGVIVTAGWRMDPDRNIQVALQEAEAKFKANYAAHAGQGDAASNAEEQEFLKSDLRYVSARVIARHDHLDKIATLPHVLAVLLQDEAASEREIKAIRTNQESQRLLLNRAPDTSIVTLSNEQYEGAPDDPSGGVPDGSGKPCLSPSCWAVSYDRYCNRKVGTKKYGACPANIHWIPGPDGGQVSRDFQLRSELVGEQSVGSNGWTKTILRWSATGPQADFGGQMSLINSAAYHATLAKPCNFQYNLNPLIPCDSSPDQVYVADSTYESEILIPNPECSVTRRDGDIGDANFGCYIDTSWTSTMPSAYIDTTFFDGPAFYNSAVGSAAMSDMVPGTTYTNVIWFRHNRPSISKLGMTSYLSAQIGTRLPAGCYTTWCSYQTKAATLQTLTIAVAPAIREP